MNPQLFMYWVYIKDTTNKTKMKEKQLEATTYPNIHLKNDNLNSFIAATTL